MPVLTSEDTARMEASIDTPSPAVEVIELTVVMPCLNEEQTHGMCVEKAVRTMRRLLGIAGEVVVVDNGWTNTQRRRGESAAGATGRLPPAQGVRQRPPPRLRRRRAAPSS